MIDLEEIFNESSIEDKSLSAYEVDRIDGPKRTNVNTTETGIEIDNQINNSNFFNRPRPSKTVYIDIIYVDVDYNIDCAYRLFM
ncbi:hypothetical protein BpHYR1_035973 [Brachionus plicatilis]|uniref:Uncharacterized protein n=1 Tax=Brachionus plicatilis TaxID=10195 RepID=A0A3M7QSR1_BRAPC|nr:hypothetical protein BpHYR1_035973 [Brachionus plicatilis]